MESEAKIEKFQLMAKGLRGRAVADLIVDATREPGLFVFGELFEVPSVKELKGTDSEGALDLLNLFAYGTWSHYTLKGSANGGLWCNGEARPFPSLDEKQQLKLKQLTTVSLALKEKRISYAVLMEELDIPTVRQLEDFLINDCIYTGLVKGRLNQKEKLLRVEECSPRDVRRPDLPLVLAGAKEWMESIKEVIASIEGRMAWAQKESANAESRQAEIDAKIADMKAQLHKDAPGELLEGDSQGEYSPFDPQPSAFQHHASRQSKRRR